MGVQVNNIIYKSEPTPLQNSASLILHGCLHFFKPNLNNFSANRTNSTSSPINEKPKAETVEDDNDDDEEETETSTDSEETESEEEPTKKPEPGAKSGLEKTDIGPLLARSANARDNGTGSGGTNASYRRSSRDDGSSSSSR